MATAFPGPYTDQGITTRGPFSSTPAPAPVTNPRDLGSNRAYNVDMSAVPRTNDLSGQQQAAKPFPPSYWEPGYDPYATGGGWDTFLDNSGS